MVNRLNGNCEKCRVDFNVKAIDGNIRTNLTAFNDQLHSISNRIAYCKRCNCNASDKDKF